MNIRTIITVPTYNNPGTVVDVVRQLLLKVDLPILVVDDGSQVTVASQLNESDLQTPDVSERLTVLRHDHNLGKGAALKTAFSWALARGYTHVLSFDGDGQHRADDAFELTLAATREPWDVVVGVRNFATANVPGISRFGRRFSNFWIGYETGVKVRDSQCGLRIYPLFYVQNTRFLTQRYDFEVEALTRLLWAGAGLTECAVSVHYPPAALRISHFRKFRDNVRISLLNIWLVTLSLFQRHLTAKKLALATTIAPTLALMPNSPGLAVAGLTAATVLCQLNAWVCLAWLGMRLAVPPSSAWSLVLGSSLLGAAASAGLALRPYFARPHPRGAWSGKSRGGVFGNFFLMQLSRWCGLTATYVCLAVIAPYFYLFAPRARRASVEYFAAMLPETSWQRRQLQVVQHFFTFGMVLLDRLFQSLHAEPVFQVQRHGMDNFTRATGDGRGVIILTAHVGGWDLSTRSLATNHQGRQSVVAEFVADTNVSSATTVRAAEKNVLERASLHNQTLPMLAYKEMLERGQVIGMMGDRPLTEKLTLLPFLGKLAAFDLTPFRIALALNVEVLFCFAFKTGFRRYELRLEPCPEIQNWLAQPQAQGGSRDEHADIAVREYAAALEQHIKRHPYQWFNFFPFFSTRPGLAAVAAHTNQALQSS